jgi:hypothetical protein
MEYQISKKVKIIILSAIGLMILCSTFSLLSFIIGFTSKFQKTSSILIFCSYLFFTIFLAGYFHYYKRILLRNLTYIILFYKILEMILNIFVTSYTCLIDQIASPIEYLLWIAWAIGVWRETQQNKKNFSSLKIYSIVTLTYYIIAYLFSLPVFMMFLVWTGKISSYILLCVLYVLQYIGFFLLIRFICSLSLKSSGWVKHAEIAETINKPSGRVEP